MRDPLTRKLMAWTIIITFAFTGVTPAFSGARIIPDGKVKVFEGKKLVQELKQEAPFPEGALLTTEGKCGVRLENFYLVADDGCTFGIVDGVNQIDLRVDNGLLYFAITQHTGQVSFLTPAGVMTSRQVRLNAAADGGVLKGYLEVTGSQVQLGVLEGGSMVVSTDKGVQEIRSGKQITLALADPISEEDKQAIAEKEQTPAIEGKETDEIPAVFFVGGAALLGAAGYAIYDANRPTGDGPTPGPASRVAP
ncbi:MAG: hypothetical protein PVG41_03830 [Desulfobacteraceae bacterium]|jgi:hypothetical protein